MIRSKKANAEKFLFWITEDVIPSIRKNGYYKANSDTTTQFKKLEEIVQQQKLKILSLENNQKNSHICTKGKYIYILKSTLDDYIDVDKPYILKIGKTTKYKIRISTYNTGHKDNTIILYRAKTNDISAVENCLKGLLSKKVYRSYREYYNITLKDAISTIRKCIKLSGSILLSEDKLYHKYKLKRSTILKGFNYSIHDKNVQNKKVRNKY